MPKWGCVLLLGGCLISVFALMFLAGMFMHGD